ncbi:MAG TPA: alpha-N-arabinofuranosidase [Sphingomonas sp.]|nr:alpha-N-arabinofuranosidase [Sphingomonas sp.]
MKTVLMGMAAALAFAAPGLARETAAPERATIEVHGDTPGATIDRHIFGQFAEHLGHGIYGGIWVGPDSKIPNTDGYRNDVLAALKELHVPVVRWPGGCFADEYHWRDGVGPRSRRPVKVNTNWGGVTEPNTFGTNEFMNFAEMIGADAYVSTNVGSGTPGEMQSWIEYMTAPAGTLADERAANGRKAPWKLAYVGLGNELWGCGGQMRPEYAADLTRRYGQFVKVPAGEHVMKMASGPNGPDTNWMEVMMREAGDRIDGIGLHYYTVPHSWGHKGSATKFDEAEYALTLAKTMKMEELITRHSAIMDKYDPKKRVALAVDEWGTWYDVEPGTNPGFLYQQNSLRDAMVAALNIGIFIKHADRVRMANIAQMVNVLQAMLLTDGPKMVRTPTYWVFDMMKPFQDATALPVTLDGPSYTAGDSMVPAVSAVAARDKGGVVHVALTNVDPHRAVTVSAKLDGVAAARASGTILTAPTVQSYNDFDHPDVVKPAAFSGASVAGDTLTVTLPAKSIVVLAVK